ncbi:uncharacterized protein L3040_003549 [Drepanopeziza brunnea f. sp. 'multigermtubi']|uniref:DUF862-domain-containing protein n=1 Tax=Marssonina brunnea f. sp. multigermtubi (strain MB_m1) TaxID=1072389 RepID=K1WYM3_MARBU|nr:uncharacterized protein MBM_04036 [Drepanopeziza brunnea f. sp. 'multigermtubi' MB_m1]EKD17667.1 hypothetical protein MBM_04036 [Drepanopeziza brunnea f. sp. 'multigermtubi' MB_m1]KAJ5046302.1 hypothetical protein L3040_003549 [Drepanopeziza brunnea f. sp. 'multigermtubi']
MDPVHPSSEAAGTSGTSGTSETSETSEIKRRGKRAKLSGYLSDGWARGKERSKEELIKGWEKGRLMAETEFVKGKTGLEHSLGLGATPNVIPPGEARVDGKLRTVEIGWHPMAVMGGKWLAEQSGKIVAKNIGKYPDPTQHWAVLVGGYIHQLWMDEKLCIIYNNDKLDRPQWKTFEVGKTRFTDEAVRQAATMTIYQMRLERPLYNLVTNNCQDFAIRLLDAIQVGAHAQFVTSFAIYQAATGDGTIKDLFADAYPEEQAKDPAKTGIQRTDTIVKAQKVMDENTTKLDNHKTKRFPLFHSKGGSA